MITPEDVHGDGDGMVAVIPGEVMAKASNLIYSNKLTIKSVIIRKVDTLLSTGSTLLIVDIRILVEHYWAAVTI